MNKVYKIYKIQFPNGKVYIGQTYDIRKRWREHLYEASSGNNLKVYRAMRKYNIDISNFSLIEDNILTTEEANAKEIYYINMYNSWHNGYNCSPGGNNGWQPFGENHPRASLLDSDIEAIRVIRSSKKYTIHQVFEFYKDIITYSGFEKLWNYDSRADIKPELNTDELKVFYRLDKRDCCGETHSNSKLTNDEVLKIRLRYWNEGKSIKDIWNEYKELYSLSGFRKIILGNTYNNVPMPKRSSLCKKKRGWLSRETVLSIREKYNEGYKVMEIKRNWFPDIPEGTLSNIVRNKIYTNY